MAPNLTPPAKTFLIIPCLCSSLGKCLEHSPRMQRFSLHCQRSVSALLIYRGAPRRAVACCCQVPPTPARSPLVQFHCPSSPSTAGAPHPGHNCKFQTLAYHIAPASAPQHIGRPSPVLASIRPAANAENSPTQSPPPSHTRRGPRTLAPTGARSMLRSTAPPFVHARPGHTRTPKRFIIARRPMGRVAVMPTLRRHLCLAYSSRLVRTAQTHPIISSMASLLTRDAGPRAHRDSICIHPQDHCPWAPARRLCRARRRVTRKTLEPTLGVTQTDVPVLSAARVHVASPPPTTTTATTTAPPPTPHTPHTPVAAKHN